MTGRGRDMHIYLQMRCDIKLHNGQAPVWLCIHIYKNIVYIKQAKERAASNNVEYLVIDGD